MEKGSQNEWTSGTSIEHELPRGHWFTVVSSIHFHSHSLSDCVGFHGAIDFACGSYFSPRLCFPLSPSLQILLHFLSPFSCLLSFASLNRLDLFGSVLRCSHHRFFFDGFFLWSCFKLLILEFCHHPTLIFIFAVLLNVNSFGSCSLILVVFSFELCLVSKIEWV